MDNFINRAWGALLIVYGVAIFVWPDPHSVLPWSTSGRHNLIWNPLVALLGIGCGAYYVFFKKSPNEVAIPSDNLDVESYNDLVVIEFPSVVNPVARHRDYEIPLSAFLANRKIGVVSGGGTPIGEYIGIGSNIDIACVDGRSAIKVIFDYLNESGYPKGSVVKFLDISYVV